MNSPIVILSSIIIDPCFVEPFLDVFRLLAITFGNIFSGIYVYIYMAGKTLLMEILLITILVIIIVIIFVF